MRATVTYDSFDGGEWGTLGARRARKGMFHGENVRVYRDGKLGPRPGTRSLGLTGLPAGQPWGVTYRPIPSSELAIIVDGAVYVAPWANTSAVSSAGTLAATPTKIVRFPESTRRIASETYFMNFGDKLYKLSSTTLAAVGGFPSGQGSGLELYRDRMVIGNDTDEYVYFSDAADFATWDALNYLRVGYEYPMFHLVAHRDGLSLFGQALIWRISGTLGVSEVLRRASTGLAVAPLGDVVLDGETCIYIPNARRAPVLWDGGIADERSLRHLEWDETDASVNYGGGIARRYNDVLFVSDSAANPGLLRCEGVWSYQAFGFATSAAMTRVDTDKFLVLSDDATPIAHMLDLELDRPGFTTDDYARPGDNSDTPLDVWFDLPEWWDEQGREVRVRSVIVNATKWNTGAAADNNLTVTVTALDRFGALDNLDSSSQSWSEAGASTTTSGEDFRTTFNFGDQGSGGGFQLSLSALKGVAIKDIVVVLDVLESRAA